MDLSGLTQPSSEVLPQDEEMAEREMTVEVGGRRFVVRLWSPDIPVAGVAGRRQTPRRRPPKLSPSRPAAEGEGTVTAPMQGTIVKVYRKAGDRVTEGEPLFILEAMKMENEVRAPVAGEIVDLRVQPGDRVSSGAVLAIVK